MSYRSIVVSAAAAAATLISASPASAASSYQCEAGALRGQVLTAPAIEPITANKGTAFCRAQKGGLASALPAPLAVSTLFAETGLSGSSGAVTEQVATASGGIADLRIGPALDLGANLPVEQALAGLPVVTVPGVGTLDVRGAVLAALQPSAEVLRVQIAVAYARAQCADGKLQLSGSSNLAGIKLAGLDLPTDKAATQTVQVVGGGTINLSQLDPATLLPPGVNLTPVTQVTYDAVVGAVPPIVIPATLAELSITPNVQEKTATRLTQRALALNLKVGGQQILDLVLGEATAGATDVDCAAAAGSPSQAALACTTRRLVLTDVFERGGRVRLTGAADRRLIGRTVNIHLVRAFGGGPRVARAKVTRDGSFRTTAALPPRRVRGSNNTRYQARLGKERSLRLKLRRRMVVRSVRVSGGKVRIRGVVTRPLASPIRTIEVRRRVSCRRWVLVKRIKPKADGSWSTTVDAPPSQQAAAYRFATKVRKFRRNPKTYPTFTLPRYVDLT